MRNRLTILALFPAFITFAQISDGGKPLALLPEFQSALTSKSSATVQLPVLDVQKALEDILHTDKTASQPRRCGYFS